MVEAACLDSGTFQCHDRRMPNDPYSLGDLARLADVTPRTVRYYVAQGLLASPEAAGPGTRYSEAHLARLRLIRRLQRDHLPLAEIRARLSSMSDEEILAAGTATEPEMGDAGPLDYVHRLMAQTGVTPSLGSPAVAEARAPYRSRLRRMEVAPPAMSGGLEPAQPGAALSVPASPQPPAVQSTRPDRSTWERLVITPDVELHVRRPLDRHTNKRVDQLERIARELLRDDDQ
jgi:DNA-binding transcriptional MerR regulator